MSGGDAKPMLMLSGVQHFAFCRRQWALIHIEQEWRENVRTFEGRLLHERVDDGLFESRGDVLIARSLHVASERLGVYGIVDVVEFHALAEGEPADDAVRLPGRRGLWKPRPVEYKRGRPKADDWDRIQLCAQAMCLEDMFGVRVPEGWLYYGETRHRHPVRFDDELRRRVVELFSLMHEWFEHGYTPPPVRTPKCRNCSLKDICLPKLDRDRSDDYLEKHLSEIEEDT